VAAGDTPRFLRPSGVELLAGRALAWLVRSGLVRGHFWVLEVRGRRSGRTISLPVDPLDLDGRRYLVCARGDANWVRNVRAAGEVVLARGRHRQRYSAREIDAAARPPILKAYLDRFPAEVRRFFPLPPGSPVKAFGEFAADYPVFELVLEAC
jgi:deazaflavin-dependent oxidoreductase (nitroreductase family)